MTGSHSICLLNFQSQRMTARRNSHAFLIQSRITASKSLLLVGAFKWRLSNSQVFHRFFFIPRDSLKLTENDEQFFWNGQYTSCSNMRVERKNSVSQERWRQYVIVWTWQLQSGRFTESLVDSTEVCRVGYKIAWSCGNSVVSVWKLSTEYASRSTAFVMRMVIQCRITLSNIIIMTLPRSTSLSECDY